MYLIERKVFMCTEAQEPYLCFIKAGPDAQVNCDLQTLPQCISGTDLQGFLFIQLELNTEWTLLELTHFAPYFGQMRNLCKVFLAPLHKIDHFPTS